MDSAIQPLNNRGQMKRENFFSGGDTICKIWLKMRTENSELQITPLKKEMNVSSHVIETTVQSNVSMM